MLKHNNNNNSSIWVYRFWNTFHHDSLFKSFHEVLSTRYVECFYYYHYLVIPFFYLWFLITKPRFSLSTLYFSKQLHYPKSSLLLLNPISKQSNAALVVHNSIFRDHVNTTLCLCNMMTLIKRYGCIVFTYWLKMLLWLIESSVAICLPIRRKTHIVLYTITFIPYVIQLKQPSSTFLLE